jgi:hypothetical protein
VIVPAPLLGRVGVGVQPVGGHDHAGKVQPVQQGLKGGHRTQGTVDLDTDWSAP